ncbi:hypothetical protein Efla_000502 [Eimeria flavescens]
MESQISSSAADVPSCNRAGQSSEPSTLVELRSLDHVAELLDEVPRLASSLGTHLDGTALRLHEADAVQALQRSAQFKRAERRASEQSFLEKRQLLIHSDARQLEREVCEAGAKVKALRSQLLSSQQATGLLLAYRSKIEKDQ